MPELPEVQRATKTLKERSVGKTITKVDTTEDKIVYTDGITHDAFAKEMTGRIILDVKRYGKIFYFELDGKGRMPVFHFGMTGNIHIKGTNSFQYKEGPSKHDMEWPPRFMKFILHLSYDGDTEDTQIAFIDPRRLARIRLCEVPASEPPISALGFDPLLNMLPIEGFSNQVLKRSCPIKALLLDQSFSAGVGNWVADETLYHARIHPEQRCNTLTDDQVRRLYEMVKYVCETAVSVDAESSRFPKNWLFNHRWGKGKRKKETDKLLLETGEPATIKWITVGGRTSAYVVELQGKEYQPKRKRKKIESDGEASGENERVTETVQPAVFRRRGRSSQRANEGPPVELDKRKKRKT